MCAYHEKNDSGRIKTSTAVCRSFLYILGHCDPKGHGILLTFDTDSFSRTIGYGRKDNNANNRDSESFLSKQKV